MNDEQEVTSVIPPVPGDVDSDNAQVAAAGRSEALLDEIRDLREEAKRDHHLILEVPGLKGKLGVRYKVIDSDQTEKIAKRLRKVKQSRNLIGSIDTLITACDQIVVHDPGHVKCLLDDDGELTEWRPIDPSSPIPVRFDSRLAEILHLPSSEAREIVAAVFQSDLSIIQQNVRVSRWMTDTTREVDDDLLGE
jgi:hypothetical protein